MDYNALKNMTVNKLRDEAKKHPDLKVTPAMKKDDLLRLLCEQYGLEAPAANPSKQKVTRVLDKKTLKHMIVELKAKKDAAQSDKNSKETAILRRRIHLLRRRTRKIA